MPDEDNNQGRRKNSPDYIADLAYAEPPFGIHNSEGRRKKVELGDVSVQKTSGSSFS